MRTTTTKKTALVLILMYLAFIGGLIICWGCGIWLAFAASVLLGVCYVIFPPLAAVSGLVWFFAGIDVAQKIMELFN